MNLISETIYIYNNVAFKLHTCTCIYYKTGVRVSVLLGGIFWLPFTAW